MGVSNDYPSYMTQEQGDELIHLMEKLLTLMEAEFAWAKEARQTEAPPADAQIIRPDRFSGAYGGASPFDKDPA